MGKKKNRRRQKKNKNVNVSEHASYGEKSLQDVKTEKVAGLAAVKHNCIDPQTPKSNTTNTCSFNSIFRQQNFGSINTGKNELFEDKNKNLLKSNTISERQGKNDVSSGSKQNSYEKSVVLYGTSSCNSNKKFANCTSTVMSKIVENKVQANPLYYGVKPKIGNIFKREDSEENVGRKFEDIDNERDFCSYSKSVKKHHDEILTLECRRLKEGNFTCSSESKKQRNAFSGIYFNWLQVRKGTLEKLETLVRDLHNDQLFYNKTQKACREIGLTSRQFKIVPSTIGFVASVSSFLSDAASGITSAVQAVNVDSYQTKFQEIMDYDANVTKGLYEARSQSIVKYQGVEEIVRKFNSHTFNSTVDDISNALEISKFQLAATNAYDSNDRLRVVDNFVEKVCKPETLEKIGDSIKTYVDTNPAALDVCKSATRAVVGVMDSLGVGKIKNSPVNGISRCANLLMIKQDQEDIARLGCTINEDLSQTKLETCIEDAIDNLKYEMEEMIEAYTRQHNPNDYTESESDYNFGLRFQKTLDYTKRIDESDSDYDIFF